METNSSKLDILCKLIKQNSANSILDCKNKIEKLQDRKIMYPRIDNELEGDLTENFRTPKGTELIDLLHVVSCFLLSV